MERARRVDGHDARVELVADDALPFLRVGHAALWDHFRVDVARCYDEELIGPRVKVHDAHAAGCQLGQSLF